MYPMCLEYSMVKNDWAPKHKQACKEDDISLSWGYVLATDGKNCLVHKETESKYKSKWVDKWEDNNWNDAESWPYVASYKKIGGYAKKRD